MRARSPETHVFKILAHVSQVALPKRPEYFVVTIDANVKEMHRSVRGLASVLGAGHPELWRKAWHVDGLCWAANEHPFWPPRCLGYLFFHWKNLSADVVAHECLHASMRWAEKRNRRYTGIAAEERIAYVHGHFMQQIANVVAKMVKA